MLFETFFNMLNVYQLFNIYFCDQHLTPFSLPMTFYSIHATKISMQSMVVGLKLVYATSHISISGLGDMLLA